MVVIACVCCVTASSVPHASAQFLTTDPPNTAQNTVSAVSEVRSTLTMLDQLDNQIEQLKKQKQNLEKLDVRNLADFIKVSLEISKLIQGTMRAANSWFDVASRVDQIWAKYGDAKYREKPFYKRLQEWEQHTDKALEFSMQTHALVAQLHGLLHLQVLKLNKKSKDVHGTVAAVELQTKMISVVTNQLAMLTELAMGAMNTWHTEFMERRRKSEATRQRSLELLGGGFNEPTPEIEPVVLPDF